ncbi:Hypothetical predicted protein [Marmota monax]|uniref:Uncharacterized protein n=1 Tax=Marmota monax TaxID=9995 RepID=A0A5E4D390_MARMO|nr:Hypothetical predicted protein [Marmota monax]
MQPHTHTATHTRSHTHTPGHTHTHGHTHTPGHTHTRPHTHPACERTELFGPVVPTRRVTGSVGLGLRASGLPGPIRFPGSPQAPRVPSGSPGPRRLPGSPQAAGSSRDLPRFSCCPRGGFDSVRAGPEPEPRDVCCSATWEPRGVECTGRVWVDARPSRPGPSVLRCGFGQREGLCGPGRPAGRVCWRDQLAGWTQGTSEGLWPLGLPVLSCWPRADPRLAWPTEQYPGHPARHQALSQVTVTATAPTSLVPVTPTTASIPHPPGGRHREGQEPSLSAQPRGAAWLCTTLCPGCLVASRVLDAALTLPSWERGRVQGPRSVHSDFTCSRLGLLGRTAGCRVPGRLFQLPELLSTEQRSEEWGDSRARPLTRDGPCRALSPLLGGRWALTKERKK